MEQKMKSYAHGQIRIWIHVSLKTKYTNEVFDIREFREACNEMMVQIFHDYGIEYNRIGFDSDHFQAIIDLGMKQVSELIKIMKGVSGRKLLQRFPEIKKKYFWGSGLWSGTKYVYSVGRDIKAIERYVSKQRYFSTPGAEKLIRVFLGNARSSMPQVYSEPPIQILKGRTVTCGS
jgi:putative transposase